MQGNLLEAVKSIEEAMEVQNNQILEMDKQYLQLLLQGIPGKTAANHKEVIADLQRLAKDRPKLPSINFTDFKSLYSAADTLRTYEYPILCPNDLIAYRAILQFYAKDYAAALESLRSMEKLLNAHKNECFGATAGMDSAFNFDVREFRFSPMTLNECEYNILLCSTILGQYNDAVKVANQLLINLKPQHMHWILVIRFLLYKALGKDNRGTFLSYA